MPHTKLGQFTVHFHNSEEFHRLKSEIFTHDCYYFESDKLNPVIIDAGAHIGLATLYFKKLFPAAQIIALEPHPDTFALLEKNVFENTLDDVELLNTALGTSDELVELHADTTPEQWHSTASIWAGAWNGQQQTAPLTVPALTLQTLLDGIDSDVDLLKLDIEGAEYAVLKHSQAALKKIKQIILEYHPIPEVPLSTLTELLEESGFHFEATSAKPNQLQLVSARRYTVNE